jgi:DNA-binding beta-propeller fold protein YncE
MKNTPAKIQFYPYLTRFRIVASALLFVAAAALATTAMMRVKLPWAVPTIRVGATPAGVDIDLASNTIYVANVDENTISVIDGTQCNSRNGSGCTVIATMPDADIAPFWPVFDDATHTLYAADLTTVNGEGSAIAVLDVSHVRWEISPGVVRVRPRW